MTTMRTEASTFTMTRRNLIKSAGAGALLTTLTSLVGCSAPDDTSSQAGSSSKSGSQQIEVTVYNGNPPFCSVDANGTPDGYDVAVLKAVDEKLDDYTFNIGAMEFNAMITACQSGSSPLVSCQLVPTEERKENFIFCKEPFTLTPMVFASTHPEWKTLDDLAGKTVCVDPINYAYSILTAYNEKYPDKAVNIQPIQNVTPADLFRQIASGQLESTLTIESSFDTVNEEAQTGLSKSNVVFCTSTYFMFNKNYQDLCDAVNDAVVELKDDGTLSKLSEQYIGVDVFTAYDGALMDTDVIGS